MQVKSVALGSDHAGFTQKEALKTHLEKEGYTVRDFGTYSADPVDYPDYVHPLAKAVEDGEFAMGILLCGSGNGVCMSANKHQGIRAALAWSGEITALARKHNNANILCLPSRFISDAQALHFSDIFLTTDFEGGRHTRRVEKISEFN